MGVVGVCLKCIIYNVRIAGVPTESDSDFLPVYPN